MMSEQRTRQDIYYLERIRGPITLREDGTVGEIGNQDVEVTSRLPSRVAGRERVITKVESRMAEIAVHASMGEYLSYEKNRGKDSRREDAGWVIEDMPQEVLDGYYSWCDSIDSPDIDGIRRLASSKVATDQERQVATVACKDCVRNTEYACRTSGYSKELYTYPIARYQDGGMTYDVPFDIADIIQLAPETVSTMIRPKFDAAGKMSAERLLIIQAQNIPKSYITGENSDETIQIAPGEVLESDIEIVIDYWNEDARLSKSNRQSWAHFNKFSARSESNNTPERYLEYLQFYVAQMLYQERKDPKDYDGMLKELHTKVGRRGLGLAYEYAYAGMGESDARMMLSKEMEGHLVTKPITYSYETRAAIETALGYAKKGEI